MKKFKLILITLTILLIPVTTNAYYKPETIKDKEDFTYLIRYYSGSKAKVEKSKIILQKDLDLGKKTINFYLKESLILDINGHKIINKGNKPAISINGDKKLLTIINSKNDTGYIKTSSNGVKLSSGNVILNNVKILSNNKKYDAIMITGGKMKLIDSKINSKNSAISIDYGYLQVESGTYIGNKYGIKINGGKAIINGGLFSGDISGLNLNDYHSLHLKKGNFVTSYKKNNNKKLPKEMINNLFVSRFIYNIGNN